MSRSLSLSSYLALVVAATSPVAAQPAGGPADAADADDAPAEPTGPTELETLAARIDDLENQLKTSEASRKSRFPIKLTGYGDLGFFATGGDGSGFRRDYNHSVFPEHANVGWVFYGDLLATQINSRGEVADLGVSPGVERFDALKSGGNPTFLVNELNLGVIAGLGPSASFTSSVNFTPRTGTEFALGDAIDVDLAQIEWTPTADGRTSVFVGKVDSVIGIEYKQRKPAQRFNITPSLIGRYTTGTAVGLKARTKLFNEHVVLAAAVTNGSFGTEQFHFFRETDTNNFKTLSGRAALRLPIGRGSLEIGASGQYGTQDGAPSSADAMWLIGADLEYDSGGRLGIRAQWLRSEAPGDETSMTYSLDLKNGGYVETSLLLGSIVGVMGRVELRDAEVQNGMERLYITKNWRATGGVRLILNPNAMLKLEYSHNGEYGGVPAIPDDVFATSAVMAF